MTVTRLTGGLTPADGSDPRTFPAIWDGFATDLEAGVYSRVPTGGSAGQVLVKDSGTDYDAVWADEPALSFPMFSNYAIGGATFKYTQPMGSGRLTTNVSTGAVGGTKGCFLRVSQETTYDEIAIRVITAGLDAGDVFRLGVYSPGTTLDGHNLILDAGLVQADTAGLKTIAINLTLDRGIYFLVAVRQSTSGTPDGTIQITGVQGLDPYCGNRDLNRNGIGIAGNNGTITGAFPSTTSGTQLYAADEQTAFYVALGRATI